MSIYVDSEWNLDAPAISLLRTDFSTGLQSLRRPIRGVGVATEGKSVYSKATRLTKPMPGKLNSNKKDKPLKKLTSVQFVLYIIHIHNLLYM